MVRFINAEVEIYAETNTIDKSGDYISEWEKVGAIKGDVQPHTMTEDEIKTFGISESKGNVRLFLYNGLYENIKVGNRAKVLSDFTKATEWFSIMPVNAWSKHGECLLIPVENEDIEEPTPDDEEEGD
jgi:head-tail adaptor